MWWKKNITVDKIEIKGKIQLLAVFEVLFFIAFKLINIGGTLNIFSYIEYKCACISASLNIKQLESLVLCSLVRFYSARKIFSFSILLRCFSENSNCTRHQRWFSLKIDSLRSIYELVYLLGIFRIDSTTTDKMWNDIFNLKTHSWN